MFGGALAGAAALALLPLASSAGPMIATGLLLAVGTAAFSTGSWAAVVDEVSAHDSGRLLGFTQLGTAGAAAAAGGFGVVIDAGGALFPGGGYAIAFGLAAVCAAAGGILAWRTLSPNRIGWRGEATAATAGASLK
jgi:MFS family permease